MRKLTTKDFYNHFTLKYPTLKDQDLRNLFMYVVFGTSYCKNTGKLMLDYSSIIKVVEKEHVSHKINTTKILQAYKAIFGSFEYQEATKELNNSWDGQCRVLLSSGLDEQDYEVIKKEFSLSIPREEKVYFRTGFKFHKKVDSEIKRITLEQYMDKKEIFFPLMNATQAKIYNALQTVSLNGKEFRSQIEKNKAEIVEAINNIQMDPLEDSSSKKMTLEEKKALQYKILGTIQEDPRIFYATSEHLRSPRIQPINTCVLSLKSDVRKAVFKGWHEVDFVSSQFVILTAMLNVKSADKILSSDKSLWESLGDLIHRKWSKEEKKVLKGVIYGICFGSSVNEISIALESIKATDLLRSDLFVELLEKRKAKLGDIKSLGFIIDPWGKRHEMDVINWQKKNQAEGEHGTYRIKRSNIYGETTSVKPRWEGSLLATLIQSIEMEIISAVFDVELKNARIMAFQHDGFALSLNSDASIDKIKTSLNEAIKRKCEEIGNKLKIDLSKMKLEFTEL